MVMLLMMGPASVVPYPLRNHRAGRSNAKRRVAFRPDKGVLT